MYALCVTTYPVTTCKSVQCIVVVDGLIQCSTLSILHQQKSQRSDITALMDGYTTSTYSNAATLNY